ncbi:MAG: Trk system potassium transporter TrkA [Clostridiales bacterium]|nr:Trk system potassium transporter TrkA [Clostridiales bacterium]
MKIIIAGDGKVGLSLTQKLAEEGHDLTLIDSNQRVLDSTIERYDVIGVQGNCASMQVLENAGVDEAELLVAATSEDEVNLLCCMTAHALNKKLHTIARIRDPEYAKQIFSMRELYALSLIVNPEKQAAREIGRLIKYPGFLQRDIFAKSRAEIVELRVEEGSRLKDIPLYRLNSVVNCQVLVCAVSRDGNVEIPNGDFIIKEEDRLFVTAPSETLTVLLKNLGIITKKAKRVMICGGGRICYYLAEDLTKQGINVQIIESDRKRCESLAEQLPDVCVINGDASNQYLLESEGISDCDTLITATGLDEMNLIVSLYGKKCGVGQVITKVSHTDSNSIYDSLGLGSIICPKDLSCNTIVRYVRSMQNTRGAAITVHSIAEGQAEALEFVVDPNTEHIGEPLKTMPIKKNVLIACITRRAKIIIPNGDSQYLKGDSVIVVVKGGVKTLQLNDIFE